jgi:uncharacterized protein with gpF-like domain
MKHESRRISALIGRSLLAAEALSAEVREKLIRRLAADYRIRTAGELTQAARRILTEVEPLSAALLADSQLAAWILGVGQMVSLLPEKAIERMVFTDPERLRDSRELPSVAATELVEFPAAEAALKDLAKRRIVTRRDFDVMSEAARRGAFTVARQNTADAVEQIHQALMETIQEGPSHAEFRQKIENRLGSGAIRAGHLETIYRTNVAAAFAAGQEQIAADPVVRTVLPFARYDAIRDARARPEHLALETLGLDGTNAYWASDPLWSLFSPPWDFNCRCTKTFLTVRQAARLGVKVAQQWLDTGVEPTVRESRLPFVAFRPPAGFASPGILA